MSEREANMPSITSPRRRRVRAAALEELATDLDQAPRPEAQCQGSAHHRRTAARRQVERPASSAGPRVVAPTALEAHDTDEVTEPSFRPSCMD